jgi:molybdopterin-containing oxidoreductase family membrane subunit
LPLSWHALSELWYAWAGFFLLLFAFGMFGLYTQLTQGHIVTGMRDNVVWGIYIVNFIFFMGISYAGALISGVLHPLKHPGETHYRPE